MMIMIYFPIQNLLTCLSTYQLGALSNSKKYPGPGSYELPDFIGPQKAVKLHSRVQTPHQPSIPKAFNRFILPKSVLVSPGPGNYQTIDCFTYNNASPYKILGRPVFPRDERKVFKEEIKTAVERPGPGQYQIISEFGNYEQPQFIGGSVPASAMNSTLTHY